MAKHSAGLLMYRWREGALEVLLVHPGGPFWAKKDAGAWSIPKGEIGPEEAPIDAARREFSEETGFAASGDLVPLGELRQTGGKLVSAWAVEGDADPARLVSNVCSIEWPPRSGRTLEFPEVDRACWFSFEGARVAVLSSQAILLDRLEAALGSR